MPATIHTLRLSKHGAQPLVILSERDHGVRYFMEAYLVWPEMPSNDEPAAKKVVELVIGVGPRSGRDDEAFAVMRRALVESVLQIGADLVEDIKHPVDEIALAEVDSMRLRAQRSLGLYPGLEDFEALKGPAATLASQLEHPYVFSAAR